MRGRAGMASTSAGDWRLTPCRLPLLLAVEHPPLPENDQTQQNTPVERA